MGNQYSNPHGLSKSLFYRKWRGMKNRCYVLHSNGYENYGGRGIKVCEEWQLFNNFKNDMYESFQNHVSTNGEDNTSLDRIDVDGDYQLDNCKWSTRIQQENNKRSNNFVAFRGDVLSVSDMCRKHNLPYGTTLKRLSIGWEVERAFTAPIRKLNFKHKRFKCVKLKGVDSQ